MQALLQESPAAPDPGIHPVLIIDGLRDVAAAFAQLCRFEGHATEVAFTTRDIGALLHRIAPSAVIMDIMMPDADGYEALKEIAAYARNLPVLLISGHGETWLRMGATLGRAHGLVALCTAQKPVRTRTVRDFLDSIPLTSAH